MKVNWRKWDLVVAAMAALIVVVVVGCSPKKSESEAPAAGAQTASPSGGAEHAMASDMVMPAGTVAGIWDQISDERAKLSTAIQNGQLKDVHHLAFGIRDLVVALADKAKVTSPGSASKLDGMVEQVKASATKLDELGDAGNLSGTQAEYAKLETVLGSIKTVTTGN